MQHIISLCHAQWSSKQTHYKWEFSFVRAVLLITDNRVNKLFIQKESTLFDNIASSNRWKVDLQAICLSHPSFSIIRYFLPNLARILPALTEKSKIKSCPCWGLNSQPLDYQSNALLTVLGRNLLRRRFLK